jgi:hypothetical protein
MRNEVRKVIEENKTKTANNSISQRLSVKEIINISNVYRVPTKPSLTSIYRRNQDQETTGPFSQSSQTNGTSTLSK